MRIKSKRFVLIKRISNKRQYAYICLYSPPICAQYYACYSGKWRICISIQIIYMRIAFQRPCLLFSTGRTEKRIYDNKANVGWFSISYPTKFVAFFGTIQLLLSTEVNNVQTTIICNTYGFHIVYKSIPKFLSKKKTKQENKS